MASMLIIKLMIITTTESKKIIKSNWYKWRDLFYNFHKIKPYYKILTNVLYTYNWVIKKWNWYPAPLDYLINNKTRW